ncbi:bifunctional glutamine-synthetase adenylyltransferase/deadenyltransferase, partial [Bifidobacterium pseudolongum]|nr:bifunctional glutamine-synthetase adenylyltransferase/deadenyltransferase [Bifidobacterium pseudolongum]
MEANSTHTVTTRDIIHAGFQEIGRAKERLNALGEQTGGRVDPPTLLARFAHSIDPDTALANLADIIQVMPGEPLTSILDDGPSLQRLIDVLGASNALGVLMRTRSGLVAAATADPARTVMVTAAARRAQLLDAV